MSKKTIIFHVNNNDYFGTLATILSLIKQNLQSKYIDKNNYKINLKILSNLKKDLMLLQKDYIITRKDDLHKHKKCVKIKL